MEKKLEELEISSENFHANLFCTQCEKDYPLDEVLYSCSECSSLLDVKHDLGALQKYSSETWKKHMEKRSQEKQLPFSSGVWNKWEWILPQIQIEHIVSLGEGNTPLIPLPRWAEELNLSSVHLKQCGVSATGSFKDLGMTVLVSHVKSLMAKGLGIRAVACASTGDTSAALSAYAAYASIPVIIFLPYQAISTAQLVQPLSNGALVFSLKTDFDGCMDIVKQLTARPSIYLANSMNPLRLEGQKTMCLEVFQQLGWEMPDWFIIPGGNLGNVSALASGIELMYDLGLSKKRPRICVAQSAQANPLYLSFQKNYKEYQAVKAKKTLASAIQIGDPVSYSRAVRALFRVNGLVEQATEEELANAAAHVDLHGMFNDPHTGVALACLEKLCSRGEIGKTESVVVVSTAHGLKFADFKCHYHEKKYDFTSRYANLPVELEARTDVIFEAIEKHFD